MKSKNNKERYKKPDESLANSFIAAFEGLKYSFWAEANMIIYFFALVMVIIAGAVFSISDMEWIVIILVSSFVIALELINTAIEVTIDMLEPQFNPLAKIAKDASAASVLITAIAALVIGIIIFLPKVMDMLV